MATLLRKLTVHEVSLVGVAANNKKFALFKSAEEVPVSENTEVAAAAEPTPEAAPAPAEPVALLKSDGSLDEDAVAKLDPVLRPQVEALFKAQAEAKAAKEAVEKAAKEAVEKAAALEKTIAEEREAAEVKEAIAKAATDFAGLPQVKPEELGPALRILRKADAKAAELVENVLKSCKALVGQALEPVGKSVPPAAESMTTEERVNKQALEMVAKGEAPTKEIAFARILESDKSLYMAIAAEKGQ